MNGLIAGLVGEGLCRDIVKRRLPGCQLFTSRALLQELSEKLRIQCGANPSELPLLQVYEDEAKLVDPAPLPETVSRDPDDDEVLAVAVAAEADAILTGDDDLLVLKTYQGIPILSPRQFVERLDRSSE